MTQRSDNVKGSPQATRIDRDAWSDVQRVGFDVAASGSGEHYTEEPVLFGRAFSRPPTLSYSLIANNVTESFPMAMVGSRNGDVNGEGLGWTSNSVGNRAISDPFFEHQGQFVAHESSATTIPSASYVIWTDQSPIETAWGAGTWPRQPGFANTWCQGEERRGKWVLSNDRSWKPPVGDMDSIWSAKYVLEVDGETNVLSPYNAYNNWYADGEAVATPADIAWIVSVNNFPDFPVGSRFFDPEGFTWQQTPPTMVGWLGYASCYATADGIFKVRAVNFHTENYGVYLDGDNDHETVPERDNAYLQQYTRHMNDLVAEFPVIGGQWNDFDIDLAMTGRNRGWPNFPYGKLEDWVNPYWRFEYSFIGTSGTSVYLDNLHMWQNMRNARPQIVTVGVAEWVTDENGAYIGAKLWFKSGQGSGVRTAPV